ncbi:MAG TPA: DUF1080 domain-containing protein [Gemmatimonadales bacterium]|nr:DUF1080 domain-containing protein [Gemmatimonadales bacterium]
MHRTVLAGLATIALSATPLTAQSMTPNTLSAQEKAEGFRLLFDGQSSAGWRGYRQPSLPANWKVEDGALMRVATGPDIVSADEFANFELRLQWKIEKGGNSGIMYRVSEELEHTYESGPEMQVLDDANNHEGKDPLTSAGANYGLYPAKRGATRPAGEWNDVRIVVDGAHIEHWLNGTKVVEYELWSHHWKDRVASTKFKQWPTFGLSRAGHLALQEHDARVAYRSIRIKVLP